MGHECKLGAHLKPKLPFVETKVFKVVKLYEWYELLATRYFIDEWKASDHCVFDYQLFLADVVH